MMPHLTHTKLMVVVVAVGVYMWALVKNTKMKTRKKSLHSVSLGLTFTGFDALKPPVISVSVAGSSTILVPSTARSTTTGSA